MRLLTHVVLGRRLHVRSLDNVPLTGPVIVVGNHVSTVDPPLVGSLIPRTDIFSMAKAEVFRTHFARFLLRGWNAFPVVRQSADRASLRYSLRCLAEGHVLVMYPEGTRAEDTALHRAHPGVGFLALRSGAPVVVAAVWGSEDVLPKGRTLPRRADVEVVFGEPCPVRRHHPDGRRVASQEAADEIMARVASLLPERYRGAYPAPVAGHGRPPPGAGTTSGRRH
jgi:1-acyl-sn-glycerol-3-phosphate acyltransferase